MRLREFGLKFDYFSVKFIKIIISRPMKVTMDVCSGRRKLLVAVGVLVLIVCVIALLAGLGTVGLSTQSIKPEVIAAENLGEVKPTVHVPNVFRPASLDQFEAGSNFGPRGHGWGSAGVSDSELGRFNRAAVSADGVPCASIAKDVLSRNGSAVDATIAGLFCVGVINTQSMGLGGGFLLTYYNRATRTAHTLDAREVAPRAASMDMFKGDSKKSTKGGLSVAVPGELRGYVELHRKFGVLPWSDLVAPAIRLCEEGHRVNWHMARALRITADAIFKEPSMSVFVNPSTGRVYEEGDTLRRPALAATLRTIQHDPDSLYSGELSRKLLQDLDKFGSIIDQDDLLQYQAKWRKPVQVSLSNGNYTFYSIPPPGSGVLLGLILNILDEYKLNATSLTGSDWKNSYQRIMESFKFAYAKRTQLGDEDFEDMAELVLELSSEPLAVSISSLITTNGTWQDPDHYGAMTAPPPNDHGTAHFSLIAPNGDAVSVTSTINLYMGAGIRSEQTGIVLNDEMDDFSAPSIINYFGIPPSPTNFISPGKRPLSSMAPSIIVDAAGDVRLVVGAAGGTKIPSGVANVVLHNLWFGADLKRAVDARRIHHQLFPMTAMHEKGFNKTVLNHLASLGHQLQEFDVGGSVVCAVAAQGGVVYANSDFRKAGHVDGF